MYASHGLNELTTWISVCRFGIYVPEWGNNKGNKSKQKSILDLFQAPIHDRSCEKILFRTISLVMDVSVPRDIYVSANVELLPLRVFYIYILGLGITNQDISNTVIGQLAFTCRLLNSMSPSDIFTSGN